MSRGAAADPPEFSVIIPTRARPGPLERCLLALAAQDGPSFEIVVVDDDKPPCATPELDAGVGVRVVRTGGSGPAVARNTGARTARGRFLLFLDDDLVPGRVWCAPAAARRRRRPRGDRALGARPTSRTLVARATALWWQEHFARKERAIT